MTAWGSVGEENKKSLMTEQLLKCTLPESTLIFVYAYSCTVRGIVCIVSLFTSL